MESILSFYGGVGAVTGANFMLEMKGEKPLRLLVDCGLLQGVQTADSFNRAPFPYDVSSIDVLFVTHAHADHIGRIPKLVKEGFKGTIYSTPATLDLAHVMLDDQCGLIDRESRNKGILPMYERKDMEAAFALWKTISYHDETDLPNGATFVFKDAGHILGSAILEIKRGERKIVFTGDLGNSPSLFLRDTETIVGANYMIIESVYGDRNHESKEERRAHLRDIIKKTIALKKTLVIPVFSLERTQDMLFEINDLVESKQIEPLPVFIDSPLAIKVTGIYRSWTSEYKEDIQKRIRGGDDIFDFSRLKMTARMEDSMHIQNVKGPKIIMAGSGMSAGGRIVNHEARYLPDPHAIILFVGYQSLGTLGRQIQDGAKTVKIHDEDVVVKADIESINGYSSHKDSDNLLEFVSHSSGTLEKVFVAMGEPKSAMFLSQRIRDNLGVKAVYPELGSEETLKL